MVEPTLKKRPSKRKNKFTPGDFNLLVRRSPTGLGLYAGEEIPKSVCIIEYVGRVIKGREEYTSNSKYLFEINSRKTIDGRDKKNIARYINHSCKPNAEIQIRKGRAFIMSIKKILPGEEIAYDYGKEYFDQHIKNKGCRCPSCVAKRSVKN